MGSPHPLTLSHGVGEESNSPSPTPWERGSWGEGTSRCLSLGRKGDRFAGGASSYLTPQPPLRKRRGGALCVRGAGDPPSPVTERGARGVRWRKGRGRVGEACACFEPTLSTLIRRGSWGEGILHALAVETGAPHLVLFVENLAEFPLETVGPDLEHHPDFPDRVNVSVAQGERPDFARARVWERGAGATLACGTGACAILVAGVRAGMLERQATVQMPGGALQVEWREDDTLWLTGDAVLVFEGVWRDRL
ncbi:MAG: diaminopimelate epimerase [Fimbriimonadales bacterium]|nr:diaminopimelate epimerase [Fimbriimonadales bacterium]